jgi:hypothetical protein
LEGKKKKEDKMREKMLTIKQKFKKQEV